jgi:hypothetical protein
MRKAMAVTAGVVSLAAMAVAAGGDIPTRYAGSFPSDGIRTNITGTFTGTRLSLRFVAQNGSTRTGSYSCSAISPTQTRCPGTYQGGGKTGQHVVTITWRGGRPVATSFGY